ncbi:DMT family transporter [Fusibacter bizertensis]|uniref:DMT family transporter n=1 Tax=Fusibacter bizertensis TaxID=1488331 RepID=A0ABT6NF71_9FIRM|nr:DMT family transporter [Fusibacter bizertensis]MDH8679071.1 DMT family transporter [Fusibacter bizertensis]
MNKRVLANMALLLTAAIWGFGFVAQRVGAKYIGAFTFNGIRFGLGAISLIPLILYMDSKRKRSTRVAVQKTVVETATDNILKSTILPGVLVGAVLYVAATLQQIGLAYTTAGKAGFITGLYMVFVPLFGILLRHKITKNSWAGVIIAVIGLYLLSVNEGFSIATGDFLVLIGAIFWAIHILTIDRFANSVDPLKLSSIQFATCSILSIITAFFTEVVTLEGLTGSLIPLLYGGLLSVGVAYTLQVVAQKHAKPSHAAIILSMESVFGAIGGALLLSERMSMRGLVGCGFILTGILISQMNFSPAKKKVKPALD